MQIKRPRHVTAPRDHVTKHLRQKRARPQLDTPSSAPPRRSYDGPSQGDRLPQWLSRQYQHVGDLSLVRIDKPRAVAIVA